MFVSVEGRVNTKSSTFPPLCVGGELLPVKKKESISGRMQEECSLSDGRLKSPRTIKGEPSVGKALRSVS
ncbi:MAG: hypothetical protein ACRC4N_14960, partial [Gammaproteobacteria bacterium]